MTPEPETNSKPILSYAISHWLYFRCLGLIFVCAFLSFCPQVLGLIGSEGIVPLSNSLTWVSVNVGAQATSEYPTIFWFNRTDQFLTLVPIIGILCGLSIVLGFCTQFALLAAGILYLSLVTVGDDFTGFQSDGMLVEVAFLSLFVVSWRQFLAAPWKIGSQQLFQKFCMERPADGLIKPHWLLWFLVFRIMIGAGIVKILSGDPTWRNLTALSYHYETQPLPTPIAWFVFHMPMWWHQFSVVATLAIEICLPFLILVRGRWRALTAGGTILLQAMIILTGNYTFLNWLLIVLCIPLLDDSMVRRVLPRKLSKDIVERVIPPPVNRNELSYLARLRRALAGAIACILLMLGAGRLAALTGSIHMVPVPILQCLFAVQSYHLVGSYGMFGVMTTTRPEVVIEGSNDGIHWLEYDFKYKPGDLDRAPCFVAPHLPRLDWRLWFAAMEPVDRTLWFRPLMRRLLMGDKQVLSLFRRNPFSDHPPKLVRAWVYEYHFTDFDELSKTGRWWRRDNRQVFLPSMSLEEPGS